MPICTYLAIKEFKQSSSKPSITLLEALGVGLLLSVIAALVYSGLRMIEGSLFVDTYMEAMIEATRIEMQEAGHTSNEIDTRVEHIQSFYASWRPYRNTLIWYVSLGTIYSLGSFLILKYFNKSN